MLLYKQNQNNVESEITNFFIHFIETYECTKNVLFTSLKHIKRHLKGKQINLLTIESVLS